VKGCIYVITNTVNGKQYVGQTTRTLEERWQKHVSYAFHSEPRSPRLASAIKHYGPEAFGVSVLEWCDSRDALDAAEKHWIGTLGTLHPSGYNLQGGGQGPGYKGVKGRTFSPEHRAKIAANRKGKKASPEAKAKMSAAQRGRKASPETIERMRLAQTGRTQSAETRAKLSALRKGRKLAPEHVEKMRRALTGRPLSAETKAKLCARIKERTPEVEERRLAALRARVSSPEYRQKKAIESKGRRHTPEAKARLSELGKARWAERYRLQFRRKAHAWLNRSD
jgi:group I intron endonuclease